KVGNRIYARVFDRDWVELHMPDAEKRRQRAAYRRGLVRAATAASVIIIAMTAMAVKAVRETSAARRSARQLRLALKDADRRKNEAEDAKKKADLEKKNAEARQQEAESQRKKAHWLSGALKEGKLQLRLIHREADAQRREALRAEHEAIQRLCDAYLAQAQ